MERGILERTPAEIAARSVAKLLQTRQNRVLNPHFRVLFGLLIRCLVQKNSNSDDTFISSSFEVLDPNSSLGQPHNFPLAIPHIR
jgi:hypothetical protein